MIALVPARLTHVGPIASKIREMDQVEAEAMGRTPKEALRLGLRTSHLCWTVVADARPIAMLGAASTSLVGGQGIPWLLGTDEVYRQGRALLTLGPEVIGEMLGEFRALENLVSTRNVRAIRLLARWGFTVGGEVQVHRGVEFVPFRMDGSACSPIPGGVGGSASILPPIRGGASSVRLDSSRPESGVAKSS